MKLLDMREKACPMPVIETKKALQDTPKVQVLVDNKIAVQNLEKMAKQLNFLFEYKEHAVDSYEVIITTTKLPLSEILLEEASLDSDSVVLITSKHLGTGEKKLGELLMKGFLYSLTELPTPPGKILFLNEGVLLAHRDSAALTDLNHLKELGCFVGVCGTCVNFYNMVDAIGVGEIVDMLYISTSITSCKNLVNL